MKTGEAGKKISRRSFLAASAMAAPAGVSVLTGTEVKGAKLLGAPTLLNGERKRNVLFISTDDMCNRLGCYGVPVIQSPNLDRLSQAGVRFEHHYCQFPLCGPSRASLMTGLAPDTTKVWDLRTDFREARPEVVTLPQLFKKNDYFTARAGKIFHYNNPSEIGTPGFDDPASWQKTANPAGYDRTHDEACVTFFASRERMRAQGAPGHDSASTILRENDVTGQLKEGALLPWQHGGKGPGGIRIAQDGCTPILPLSKNGDLGVPIAGYPSDGDETVITDYMVAEAAIALIEEHRNTPWFIGAGFYRPHVPFIVPSKYYDLYDSCRMELPRFDPSELLTAPRIAYTSMNPNYGMSIQQHREAIRGYYAAISFVDAQVGRLLDAVDRLDLAKDTTIVFWSDHGFMVGEHGQWEKMMLFEASTRVPFIIAGAGVPLTGRVCNRVTEHLDIYPTLVEMCGLEGSPSSLQGQSLVPLLAEPEAAWPDRAITQVTRRGDSAVKMGYSIRNPRYRYTMWAHGEDGEELYDYNEDPSELRNLASVPASSRCIAALRSELERVGHARGMQRLV